MTMLQHYWDSRSRLVHILLIWLSAVITTGQDISHTGQEEDSNGSDFQGHYKMPLPSSCIDFESKEGKQIFLEAIRGDYMKPFYTLMPQLRTQDHMAYCALATFVVAFNGMKLDPNRIWKGRFRWYDEHMVFVQPCVTREEIERRGVTMEEFVCIGKLNNVDVSVTPAQGVPDDFRRVLKSATSTNDSVLVVQFNRQILGQHGSGHFSPVGGYHEERDLVLVLDVARYKYPPYWVNVSLLYDAMKSRDSDTGEPRGYYVLSRKESDARSSEFETQVSTASYRDYPNAAAGRHPHPTAMSSTSLTLLLLHCLHAVR